MDGEMDRSVCISNTSQITPIHMVFVINQISVIVILEYMSCVVVCCKLVVYKGNLGKTRVTYKQTV